MSAVICFLWIWLLPKAKNKYSDEGIWMIFTVISVNLCGYWMCFHSSGFIKFCSVLCSSANIYKQNKTFISYRFETVSIRIQKFKESEVIAKLKSPNMSKYVKDRGIKCCSRKTWRAHEKILRLNYNASNETEIYVQWMQSYYGVFLRVQQT